MKLVLKIVGSEWNNASRDKRELSVYQELGYDVVVMAKGKEADYGRVEDVDGFKVLRYSTRPLGSKVPASINRFFALFTWAKAARKLKADVISGHDLIPGLLIAWLSTIFCRRKPKLIYDAHEFELGTRTTDSVKGKLRLFWVSIIEKYLMKRCAFSIMVNDSISDEVQNQYQLTERPVVVRNTPNYWEIDTTECEKTRQFLLDSFANTGEKISFLVMYHGAVLPNRGIECIIRAIKTTENIGFIVLGKGSPAYIETIRELAAQEGVPDKIYFHPAVAIDQLWRYVGAVDISLAPIELTVRNHYFSLPNKFFESIQSMTPIIASNVPEMRRLIERYRIGLVCEPGDPHSLSECIRKMKEDQVFYQQCKSNIRNAKQELCWEKEKGILVEAVNRYL